MTRTESQRPGQTPDSGLPAACGRRPPPRPGAAGLERQVPLEVADFTSAAALVRNGLGIAFLPASVVAMTPGLPAIEVAGPLNWRISVATPAHRRVSAASRAFLAELVRATGSSPE
jgi:DNA-binding transcriptional LysR family regulator